MTRREHILAAASDLGKDFMHYGRKEDEELPEGEIEKAIEAGEVSLGEIIGTFVDSVNDNWNDTGEEDDEDDR